MSNNQLPTENVDGRELEAVEMQYWVDMRSALERLEANEDFKKVVLEGYFRDKAINGVSLLATEYIVANGLRARVMESLVAISQLEDYFKTIKVMGGEGSEELFDEGGE
jgi:hypothetical protein